MVVSSNGTTAPIAGWCESFPPGCSYDGIMLAAIWTSFVGQRGERQGVWFRPSDMSPASLSGPGMVEAIRVFRWASRWLRTSVNRRTPRAQICAVACS